MYKGRHRKPTDNTERRAYDLLTKGFGAGANGVLSVVVDAPNVPRDRQDEVGNAVVKELKKFDHVASVSPPIANPRGDVTIVNVTPTSGPASDDTRDLVDGRRTEGEGHGPIQPERPMTAHQRCPAATVSGVRPREPRRRPQAARPPGG